MSTIYFPGDRVKRDFRDTKLGRRPLKGYIYGTVTEAAPHPYVTGAQRLTVEWDGSRHHGWYLSNDILPVSIGHR